MEVTVTRLRCTSWDQLAEIFTRDIRRGALTIRTRTPPPVGSHVTIALVLPSGTTLALDGTATLCAPAGTDGSARVEVQLKFAAGDLWMIESALAGARTHGLIKTPLPLLDLPPTTAAPPAPVEPTPTPARVAFVPPAPPAAATAPVAAAPVVYAETTALEEDPSTAALEASLLGALEAEIDGLLGKDSFQILGVSRSATIDEIDVVFAKLSLKYHPDSYARFTNQRLWDLAGELYILMGDAHARVTSPQAMSVRAASDHTASLGDRRLADGQWEEAARQFEESLRIDPGSLAARIGHEVARAMHFLDGGGPADRAIAHLEGLSERAPNDERVAAALVAARRRATNASRKALEAEMGEDLT